MTKPAQQIRILFNDSGDLKTGSTRVFIHNIAHFMDEYGADVTLNDWENYQEYDVVIFGKSVPIEALVKARELNTQIAIGEVNPSDRALKLRKAALSDFLLAGSLDEMDTYLVYQKPVLYFPLLERFSLPLKVHEDSDHITLGYHGNHMHILGMTHELIHSMTKLSKERPVNLKLLYDVKTSGRVSIDVPGVNVIHQQWALDTFGQDIQTFDIGLVPSLTKVPNWLKKVVKKFSGGSGFYNDKIIRYKNTTNSGRAFVFHQLGIPVVADQAPCNYHLLGDPDNGYIACTMEGWYRAIKALAESAEHRHFVAQNAKAAFDREYDTKVWSRRMLMELSRVVSDKKNPS